MLSTVSVVGLDPGPTESAYVVIHPSLSGVPDNDMIAAFGILPNAEMRRLLIGQGDVMIPPADLAVEMIASYGMPVGREVFETCVWIGRFGEIWRIAERKPGDRTFAQITRGEVKLHLCRTSRAKDPNVRQALIDRWGGQEKAIGRKASPGKLYGISSHCWAALAVAVTRVDQMRAEDKGLTLK